MADTRYACSVTRPAHATSGHVPVLLDEVIRLLEPRPGERYVDATAGLGGHAAAVAPRLEPRGDVVLNDLDHTSLDRATSAVHAAAPAVNVRIIQGSIAQLPTQLADDPADLLLADFGFASTQVDDPARGFSFKRDGPLDMRMDPSAPITAAELVATLTEPELADLIRRFGQERNARAIARKLVAVRTHEPITTTAQLAAIVRSIVGPTGRKRAIDAATRTFQALRIAVNDEIGSIETLLRSIARAAQRLNTGEATWLTPDARIAMISFHSLEDRPIKRVFADLVERGLASALTRKPIRARTDELARNVRARSAKLRAIRLCGEQGNGPKAIRSRALEAHRG